MASRHYVYASHSVMTTVATIYWPGTECQALCQGHYAHYISFS